MAARKPARFEFTLIKLWHAWVSGGFLVAYLTADEDTYAMHVFAGYAVLAAIAVRLLMALVAPEGSPLRLTRPSLSVFRDRKGRHPLFAWLAALLLAVVGGAAVSGLLADATPWLEDPHEAVSEASVWVIAAHVAFVGFLYGGKRLLKSLMPKESLP
ncbi:MAG: hypothetical protein HY985_10375 [Magnetospirillum sp.]|nr:hypothetical protein [Magnetospirillum sp.]